jgi:hypothetical protein
VDRGTGSIQQVLERVGEITQFKHSGIEEIPSMVGFCFIPYLKIFFTDSWLKQVFLFDRGTRRVQVLIDSVYLLQLPGIAYYQANNGCQIRRAPE